MGTATRTGTNAEIDTDAVAKVIDYLSNPYESRSIDEIATAAGLTEPDAKAVLNALKTAKIMKVSGRGKSTKWYIDPDLARPVDLPAHLRPVGEAQAEPETDDEATMDNGTGEEPAGLLADDESAAEAALPETDPDGDEAGGIAETEVPAVEATDAEGDAEPGTDRDDGVAGDTDSGEAEPADPVAPEDNDLDADDSGTEAERFSASTVEPAVRKSSGVIDPEAAFPFHMLPVAEAEEGATVGDLHRLTGMPPTRILKALWGMRQIGAAVSTAPFHPSRGEWRRASGAVLEQLATIRMADMPSRVVCPDCGHDTALRYVADARQQTVAAFDPEAPAPEGLFDRDAHDREPQVMFCAMMLCQLGEAVPVELAVETGHDEATVLRALWALRACRLVECTEVHRPTGGTWQATEQTLEGAPYARLADAPDALGCATCGHSLGARNGNGGGKGMKGVSRETTGDGGKPLPDGSLDAMIKAWATAVRNGECAEEQATCAGMRRLLAEQADAGALQRWLDAWSEANPADEHARLVPQIKTSLAEGNRPRSASAVKNALERIGKQKFSPIVRVAGPVLTFRAKTSRTK